METKTMSQHQYSSAAEYRESVRRLIDTEIGNIIDEEMEKAARELVEEQRNAIHDIVEQYKVVIRQVVEEEKKGIWARVGELRKFIVKLGMGEL